MQDMLSGGWLQARQERCGTSSKGVQHDECQQQSCKIAELKPSGTLTVYTLVGCCAPHYEVVLTGPGYLNELSITAAYFMARS